MARTGEVAFARARLNGAYEAASETRRTAMERQMVRISVEVRSGSARFRIGVQASSIREALGLVKGKYPRGVVRVLFPIEPEGFFVREPSAPAGVEAYEVAA
jgi:hypothetical protein